jgi:hypothetical protein
MEELAASTGGLGLLSEKKHLEPATGRALAQLYPGLAETGRKVEVPDWPKVGPVDAIVRYAAGVRQFRYLIELKWCGKGHDVLHEAVWDLFKMANASMRQEVEAAYLLTGASAQLWNGGLCRELFDSTTHSSEGLCTVRFPTGSKRLVWDWMLEGGNDHYPDQVPAQIKTNRVGAASLSFEGEAWELRMVKVEPADEMLVPFADGWPKGERPSDARRPLSGGGS